ncbi:hypothetical protein BT69DRAFT_1255867 [Atractiella rhizophila]|nr:hypothetical protein BT69DRAFT_1255867 [Atractiella rhizophila]
MEKASVEADNTSALLKLGFFAFILAVLPIVSYFWSLNYLFEGKNQTYAALTAVVVANIILVGYIVVAVREDQEDRMKEKEKKQD